MNFSKLTINSPESPSSSSGSGDPELRLASHTPKKSSGRKKFTETRHPVYRGVRRKNPDRWVCELREPTRQTRIWLGTFPTAEMAARAYDVAVIALRGPSACVNFADSFSTLLIPDSTEPKVIQAAAAAAAEAFRPPEPSDPTSANDAKIEPPSFGQDYQGNYLYLEDEDHEEIDFGMPGSVPADMSDGMMLSLPGYADPGEIDLDSDTGLWNY